LQWRVTLTGHDPDARVDAVTVSGWEPNLPPRIERLQLQPYGPLSAGGLMNAQENVTQRFKSGLRVEYNVSRKSGRRVDPERGEAIRPIRSFLWKATDPNDDRLLYQLEYRRVDEETWRPIGEELREEVGSWDTTEVPDGRYLVRLCASDRLDNPPEREKRSYRTTAPIVVDNSPPQISDLELQLIETGFRLQVRAKDAANAIAGATLELPDGTSERLDPVDGICDSRAERFDVAVDYPPPDRRAGPLPWRVRVEVYDRHGNVAAAEGEVK
jgi:hypothetical protein